MNDKKRVVDLSFGKIYRSLIFLGGQELSSRGSEELKNLVSGYLIRRFKIE